MIRRLARSICRIGLRAFERTEVFGARQESVCFVPGSAGPAGARPTPSRSAKTSTCPPKTRSSTRPPPTNRTSPSSGRPRRVTTSIRSAWASSAATPGVTVGESVYPKGEIHKDEYFGEQEDFSRHVQGDGAAHGREARRHGRTQAQVAGLRGCRPVLSAERLGRHCESGGRRAHHLGRQTVRSRETRRSKVKKNISTSTRRSRSRTRRCRSTTSSSTGASPTATTSTSSASRSSRQEIRRSSARSCCPRAKHTATNISASRKSIARASTPPSRCRLRTRRRST